MESLVDGFTWLSEFFTGDVGFWHRLQAEALIIILKGKIIVVQNAWFVAKALMESLDISTAIQSAFASVDSTIMDFLTVLRVPDVVNLLLQAHVTRFVLALK